MKLYEMSADFSELFDNYDAIVNIEFTPDGKGGFLDDDGNPVDPEERRREMQQAWFDTLDGMEQELVCKAENVAVYIKAMEAEAKSLKAEEDKLKVRRQAKENAAKRMREYLMGCMKQANISKIDEPRAIISLRNNPESVEISDENDFISWANEDHDEYLRYKAPEINKTAVKNALKSGAEIPFAALTRSQSLTIK